MAQEIVITSVRRGIDGESGYQPVLRTRGMKAAVAERMQIRSGYSHPYSHGDPRNPVVFIHRIEQVAGQTLHVLGRICDAGSDHTGRSNFLAHLAALEDTEARRKAAGPADVARRFAFKTSWNEPPREADPPPVIGGDRGPAACGVWRAAGLDPGLAGDLAEAAANGKEIRLIVRQGDDALALFADAIALLPPAKRWQVTFNTCEIEPFDAVWRAVREDLPQARSWRGTPGVIDLTNPATKGSENSYARFARGAESTLPWQTPVSEPTPAPAAPKAPADLAEEPSRRPVDATPPSSADSPRVAKPTPVEPTPTLPDRPIPPSVRRKRNYLERTVRPSDDRIEFEDFNSPSSHVLRFTGFAVLIVLFTALVGGFVAVQMNPELLTQIATIFREATHTEDKHVARVGQDEAGGDETSLGVDKQAERKRTFAENERKQRGAEAADRKAKEDLAAKAAQEAARIAAEQKQKEESEQADREATRQQLTQKQTAAYAALAHIEGITEEDLPVPSGLGDGPPEQATICTLNADALIDLSLDLAVPKDPLKDGEEFAPTIEPVRNQPLTWNLSSTPSREFDKNAPPIPLATITVKDGKLTLMPASTPILANQRFSHLRRSVLLLKARNPENPNEPIGVVKAIQLVRPTSVSPFAVSLLEGSQTFKLPPPAGIVAFPKETTMAYEVAWDYDTNGKDKSTVIAHSEQHAGPPIVDDLFTCPHPTVGMTSNTTIGLSNSFSAEQLTHRITPSIKGATYPYTINEIRDGIHLTEETSKQRAQQRCRALQQEVEPALITLESAIQGQKPWPLLKKYNQDIDQFLAERQQKESTGGLVPAWLTDCNNVIDQAKAIPRVGERKPPFSIIAYYTSEEVEKLMTGPRQQWEKTYLDTLRDWLNDRKDKISQDEQQQWEFIIRHFKPLLTDARVLVRSITTKAFKGGDDYDVTLLIGDPNVGSQLDTPAQALIREGNPSH